VFNLRDFARVIQVSHRGEIYRCINVNPNVTSLFIVSTFTASEILAICYAASLSVPRVQ
jgi:hypothetical protein